MQDSPRPSIIFLATPTSATGSIWRILSTLCEGRYTINEFTAPFYKEQRMEELKTAVPPEQGHVLLFNAPHFFNKSLDVSKYRLVVNARDPRDLVCNQYYWKLQHPILGKTEEEIAALRAQVVEEGIDAFALKTDNSILYNNLYPVVEKCPQDQMLFATYALVCLEFDLFLERLCTFLNIMPTETQRAKLELERTSNLKNNPQWIGQQWSGSDTLPGRFLRELKPETIAALNQKYKKALDFLSAHDHPSVTYTYAAGR